MAIRDFREHSLMLFYHQTHDHSLSIGDKINKTDSLSRNLPFITNIHLMSQNKRTRVFDDTTLSCKKISSPFNLPFTIENENSKVLHHTFFPNNGDILWKFTKLTHWRDVLK